MEHVPWFVIPANYKWFRNPAVTQIAIQALASFQMEFPKPMPDIPELRMKYHKAEEEGEEREKGECKERHIRAREIPGRIEMRPGIVWVISSSFS